jgi:hypothetical protein
MTSPMKFNGENIMSCHVYDVDKSLHDKAPSYHTTCGCQHDFFGEFSHCSNKKKLFLIHKGDLKKWTITPKVIHYSLQIPYLAIELPYFEYNL